MNSRKKRRHVSAIGLILTVVLCLTMIPMTVNAEDSPGVDQSKNQENALIKNTMTLTLNEKDYPNHPVQGAEFKIKYWQQTGLLPSKGEWKDVKRSGKDYKKITDENGKVKFENLLIAIKYKVVVSGFPSGNYEKKISIEGNGDEYGFSFKLLKSSVNLNATIKKLPTGTLVVYKKDAKSHNALPGATFELKKWVSFGAHEGKYVDVPYKGDHEYKVTTDKRGKAVFKDLNLKSKYKVVEVRVPKGYDPRYDNRLRHDGKFSFDRGDRFVELYAFNKKLPTGSITLVKKGYDSRYDDRGESLANVVFGLYQKGKPAHVKDPIKKTSRDGKVRWENLKPGVYEVKEIKPLPEYNGKLYLSEFKGKTLRDHKIHISDRYSENVYLVGKNYKVKADVDLKLIDSENYKSIRGAEFYLEKDGKYLRKSLKKVNRYGELEWDNLIAGSYKIVQKTYSYGYEKGSAKFFQKKDRGRPDLLKHQKFFIGNYLQGKDVQLIATNDASKGSITLYMSDKGDKRSEIAGAQFMLLKWNGDKYSKVDKSFKYTSHNGIIKWDGLRYGHYKVEKLKTPLGYKNDLKLYKMIGKNKYEPLHRNSVSISKRVEDVFLKGTYTQIKGNVYMKIMDSANKKPIKNAVLELKDKNGQSFEATTDKFGNAKFKNLPWGKYDVVVKSATGYDKDSLDFYKYRGLSIKIGYADGTYRPIMLVGDIDRLQGSFMLNVYDKNTKNPIKGVKFGLEKQNDQGIFEPYKDSAGNEVIVESDKDGKVLFEKLPWGNFNTVLKSVPEGLDSTLLNYSDGDGTFSVGPESLNPTEDAIYAAAASGGDDNGDGTNNEKNGGGANDNGNGTLDKNDSQTVVKDVTAKSKTSDDMNTIYVLMMVLALLAAAAVSTIILKQRIKNRQN